MHPTTLDIAKFKDQFEANEAGYTIPLTDEEAAHLDSVPRTDRIAALGKFRGSPLSTSSYIPPRRARDSR